MNLKSQTRSFSPKQVAEQKANIFTRKLDFPEANKIIQLEWRVSQTPIQFEDILDIYKIYDVNLLM